MTDPSLHTPRSAREPALPLEVQEALREERPEERAAFEEVWNLAGRSLSNEPSEADFARLGQEIWQNLEAMLPQEAPAPEQNAAPVVAGRPALRLVRAPLRLVQPRALRYSALAACIALLLAVGLSLRTGSTQITAPRGETVAIQLPDGSQVELNGASTLTYSDDFGDDTRTVKLKGEAYFDVETAEVPFVIESFNGSVTVLGTRFNVRARQDDPAATTVVSVAEGTVRVAPRRAPKTALVLEAGQAARIAEANEAPVLLDDASTTYALAWRDGGFKFTDVPLATVLAEVERRYDVRIQVENKDLLNAPVAILLEKPLAADEILRDLSEYNGFDYRQVPGGFEIFQPAAD